jgi:hypothetical protein
MPSSRFILESPRIASSIDLPLEERQRPRPHPEGISRYRVIPLARQRTSHGIARRLPAAGEGFAVMSGCAHEVTLMQGSFFYPTRNFAESCYL